MITAWIPFNPKSNSRLHQGHKDIIEFAKGFAPVTISINYDQTNYIRHLTKGGNKPPEGIFPEQKSLYKDLGVNVREVKWLRRENLPEHQKMKEACQARVNKIKDKIPENLRAADSSNLIIYGTYLMLVEALIRRHREPDVSINEPLIYGPDIEHFFAKFLLRDAIEEGIFKNGGLTDPITIFPKTVKDSYGRRLRSSVPELMKPYWDRMIPSNMKVIDTKVYDDSDIFLGGRFELTTYQFIEKGPPGDAGVSILSTESNYVQ